MVFDSTYGINLHLKSSFMNKRIRIRLKKVRIRTDPDLNMSSFRTCPFLG
jgi:hypothetical protein